MMSYTEYFVAINTPIKCLYNCGKMSVFSSIFQVIDPVLDLESLVLTLYLFKFLNPSLILLGALVSLI